MRHRRPDRRRRERERGAPRRAARRRCRSGLRSASAACRAAPRAPRRSRTGAPHRPRVRRVAEQRAERDDDLAAGRARDGDDVVAERAPRRLGSTPSSSTRSRPPPGVRAAENVERGPRRSCAATPSISSTVGRAAWKSRYSSGSSDANATRAEAACEPAHRVGRRVAGVVPALRTRRPAPAAAASGCAFHRTVTCREP